MTFESLISNHFKLLFQKEIKKPVDIKNVQTQISTTKNNSQMHLSLIYNCEIGDKIYKCFSEA